MSACAPHTSPLAFPLTSLFDPAQSHQGIRFGNDDGPSHPHEEDVEGMDGVKVDHSQLGTAQKLLLFWRKPARKCWWDGVDIVVPHTSASASSAEADGSAAMAAQQADEAEAQADMNATTAGMTGEEVELLRSRRGRKCRVWARRVWTLELSLVSPE